MGAALQPESDHRLEVAVSRPKNIHEDGVLIFGIVTNSEGQARSIETWDEAVELKFESLDDILMIGIYTATTKEQFLKGKAVLHSCVFVPVIKLRDLASAISVGSQNQNEAKACHITGLEMGLMARNLPRPWDLQEDIPHLLEYCAEFERSLDLVRTDENCAKISVSFLERTEDGPSMKKKPPEIQPNGITNGNNNAAAGGSLIVMDLTQQNEKLRKEAAQMVSDIEGLRDRCEREKQSAEKLVQNERKEVMAWREKEEAARGDLEAKENINVSLQKEMEEVRAEYETIKGQLFEQETRKQALEKELLERQASNEEVSSAMLDYEKQIEKLSEELSASTLSMKESEEKSQSERYDLLAQMEELRIANNELRRHAVDCERRLSLVDKNPNNDAVVQAALTSERAAWKQQMDAEKQAYEQVKSEFEAEKGSLVGQITELQRERGEMLQKQELLQGRLDDAVRNGLPDEAAGGHDDDDGGEKHEVAPLVPPENQLLPENRGSGGFLTQLTALLYKQELMRRKRAVRFWIGTGLFVFFIGFPGCVQNISLMSQADSSNEMMKNSQARAAMVLWVSVLSIVYSSFLPLQAAWELVREKRERTREGMRMMGMRDSTYYLSFLIHAIPIALLDGVGATALSLIWSGLILRDTEMPSAFALWCLGIEFFFYFFILEMICVVFGMALSTFFRSNWTAVLFILLAWFVNLMPVLCFDAPVLGKWQTYIDLKAGYCFLPGYHISHMVAYLDGQPGNMHKFFLWFFFSALWVSIAFLAYCYLDQIIPHKLGRTRPPWFPFTPTFWRDVFGIAAAPAATTTGSSVYDHDAHGAANILNPHVEIENDPVLLEKAANFQSVTTTDLEVTFRGTHGEKIRAVDKLNLTMYEGQIFCLLGFNGAGKTTTMHAIAGLTHPTAGKINAYGVEIPKEIDTMRQSFGFCPQHNQLFSKLTVGEHLKLYGRLRGIKLSEQELTKLVDDVGLSGFTHQAASALSGGMKRKLSVAIAFVGNPRFVILDEASSGMDTFARRQLWEFLKSRREGRVIMVTTHFMDEADAISDRVAVMAHGKLQAMGTPAFLKKQFGCGYSLVCSAADSAAVPALLHNVKAMVQEAVAAAVNNKSDSVLSSSADDVTFQTQGKEIMVRMPYVFRDLIIPSVLDQFEALKTNAQITSYGLSVANLDDVFQKIAESNHNHEEIQSQVNALVTAGSRDNLAASPAFDANRCPSFGKQLLAMFKRRVFSGARSKMATIASVVVPALILTGAAFVGRAFYGPSDATSDNGSAIGSILLVSLLVCLSLAFSTLAAVTFVVQEKHAGVKEFLFLNGCNYSAYWLSNLFWDLVSGLPWLVALLIFWAIPWFPFRVWIPEIGWFLVMYGVFMFSSAFYAYLLSQVFSSTTKVVFCSLTLNGLLVWVCVMLYVLLWQGCVAPWEIENPSIFNEGDVSGSLQLVKYSLISYDWFGGLLPAYPLVAFWVMAGPFKSLPPAKVSELFVDRALSQKVSVSDDVIRIQDFRSGSLHPMFKKSYSYYDKSGSDLWVTTGFDLCLHRSGIRRADYSAYEVDFQQVVKDKWPGLMAHMSGFTFWGNIAKDLRALLTPEYIEKHGVFDQSTMARISSAQRGNLIDCLADFITKSSTPPSPDYKYPVSDDQQRRSPDDKFPTLVQFRIERHYPKVTAGMSDDDIFQHVALSGHLFMTDTTTQFLGLTDGFPYVLRGVIMCFIFGILAFGIEFMKHSRWWKSRGISSDLPPNVGAKDHMVLAEEDRVRTQTDSSSEIIRVKNLRRVFKTKKQGIVHAVRGVSWAANRGQVFGLLGTNGAGKTTTFKMMCGVIAPSAGEATIHGVDMTTSDTHKGRRMIGYCPQFDVLWPKLTVHETLSIYATLRGFTGNEVNAAVDDQIQRMQLSEFRDRRAGALSGGNKRKLSVAIALIGQPPVLFLDEPSTGMDPVARRFMWSIIQNLADARADRVVVLTTHSMDEAQALCERIAIQVDGSFRCIGTPQQIKDLHGSGYELTLRFAPPPMNVMQDAYLEERFQHFQKYFADFGPRIFGEKAQPVVVSTETNSLSVEFVLNLPTCVVATLMRELQPLCQQHNVEDWFITQQTLERVFNMFAISSEAAQAERAQQLQMMRQQMHMAQFRGQQMPGHAF